jgi:plastocyanin
VPHLIASSTGKFKSSQVLDTGGRFELTLAKAGTYPYFCSLHPMMQGTIVVT